MNIPQLSVFLENRPGHLRKVLAVLADHGVNIKFFTIAEVKDFGILRMIVDKPTEAHAALKAAHFVCSLADVLAVALDDVEVRVEVSEAIFSDELKVLAGMSEQIAARMRSVLGISAKITLVEPDTIERSAGKAKRVIDRRTS